MTVRTDSSDINFQKLVKLLDEDLKIRDGSEHAFYAQYNKTDDIKNVVVYYENNNAVGCGAFKKYDDHKAEIKRMFVHSDHRGKKIGRIILKELESWAAESGYHECILETGKKQPEAIKLYQNAGYKTIPNFGQYANAGNSVCMNKLLQ
jgi:GNAT superfamily N-acetyltransferase